MAGFFERRRFRKDVMARLHAMLLLYPGGVRNLERNYPNLPKAIDGNCDAGDVPAAHSAVIIAGSILANEFGALDDVQRKAVRDQVARVDLAAFKKALRTGEQLPSELLAGTSLVALAFIVVNASLTDGEITEHQFKSFTSEVIGYSTARTPINALQSECVTFSMKRSDLRPCVTARTTTAPLTQVSAGRSKIRSSMEQSARFVSSSLPLATHWCASMTAGRLRSVGH